MSTLFASIHLLTHPLREDARLSFDAFCDLMKEIVDDYGNLADVCMYVWRDMIRSYVVMELSSALITTLLGEN